MEAIASVVVGAILTGIVGNLLVQRWQMRGWREQQRQLGNQAELEELKRLVEEIMTRASDRLNAMRRLSGSLAPGSVVDHDDALRKYREELIIWNGKLNSFYVRLGIYVDYYMAIRLEREIHESFVSSGQFIEALVRAKALGHPAHWSDLNYISGFLSGIHGRIYNYGRNLLSLVEQKREDVFYGRKLFLSKQFLSEYSLFELIKALFTSDVDRFYVVRSA